MEKLPLWQIEKTIMGWKIQNKERMMCAKELDGECCKSLVAKFQGILFDAV